MRLVVWLGCALLVLSASNSRAEEPKNERVERALASKSWRVPRVIVLPLVGAATAMGSFFAIAVPVSTACGGLLGGDFISPCAMGLLGGLALTYTALTPAIVTLVGALMKGRGNYWLALAGSASAMLLAVASAFVALPTSFAFPLFTGMVLAPIGSVIGYEVSSASAETRALDEGPVVLPTVAPLRDGFALGVSITNW